MGVAVAIASRMETAAEPGTVLVSEHTYRLISSQFDWQPLGEISIKGLRTCNGWHPIVDLYPRGRNVRGCPPGPTVQHADPTPNARVS